jgi:ribosomal protein S18 acetylase RimI-like enzyme
LRLSYVNSQDCHELADIRTPHQALLTHRASGSFDPARWFVLCDQARPMGILLLSMIPRVSVMEIVYMGVSQPARGRGVAGLLLEKALHVASRAKADNLILAVDARNEPARRLYARWNFRDVARRTAWIANLCAVER